MTCIQYVPIIQIGYEWQASIELEAEDGGDPPAFFPVGCQLRSQVRKSPSSPALAELTTQNGGITRISDHEIKLKLTATTGAGFAPGVAVSLDLVRTDVSPAAHLGIGLLDIPVALPFTRTP